MPLVDWFLLLAVRTIPLLILEMVKLMRNTPRQRQAEL
jgi:hypothetical protein